MQYQYWGIGYIPPTLDLSDLRSLLHHTESVSNLRVASSRKNAQIYGPQFVVCRRLSEWMIAWQGIGLWRRIQEELGRQKWHSLNRTADKKSLLLINMKVQQTRPGRVGLGWDFCENVEAFEWGGYWYWRKTGSDSLASFPVVIGIISPHLCAHKS